MLSLISGHQTGLEHLDIGFVSFISPPLQKGSPRPWTSASAHLGCSAGNGVGTGSRVQYFIVVSLMEKGERISFLSPEPALKAGTTTSSCSIQTTPLSLPTQFPTSSQKCTYNQLPDDGLPSKLSFMTPALVGESG